MKTNRDRAIIIFARSPKLGKVKTRLSKTLGNDFALNFYKLCAGHVFDECRKLSKKNTSLYLFYTGNDDEEALKKWAGDSFIYFPQTGANLGQRMENAFKKVFADGAKKVLIIGTDVPDINLSLFENAFELLNSADVVIGPSPDGGYYLLGMKKLYGNLFGDIHWSTCSVFKETMKKIESNKLKNEVMEKLYDIDTEEDLRNWISLNDSSENNLLKQKILKELPGNK